MFGSRVDEAISSGCVPEGITAEYLNESRDRPAATGIIVVTGITWVVVGCRLLSRAFINRRFGLGLDDGLALVSLILFTSFAGLCIVLINLGSGRHGWYVVCVLDVQTLQRQQILDVVAKIVYTTALFSCRCSGLAFFYRICSLHKGFSRAIKALLGFFVATYLPQIFVLIFRCTPVTALWPYGWEPGSELYTCIPRQYVHTIISAPSLVADIFLLGMPVAMLKNIRLPRQQKIQLGCILLPGIGVVGISVGRLVLVSLWHTNDTLWRYNPMLALEVSEIGGTLMALSIPGLKPLVDTYIRRKSTQSRPGRFDRGIAQINNQSNGTELRTLRAVKSTK